MKKNTKLTILISAISVIMTVTLVFFCLYVSSDSYKRTRKPLPLVAQEFDSYESIDFDADNIVWSQNLLLVNSNHPLPEDFEATITTYKTTDVLMNECVIYGYSDLSDGVFEHFNNHIWVESSYRDREHQTEIYESEGPTIAALPGTSEHETGLALDIYVTGFAGAGFIKSDEGKYVNKHCHEYGFIIRYPDGEKEITGFDYEPWHIRYVGQPHATLIGECGITLEEYIDYFKVGTYYSYDTYLIAKMPEDSILVPSIYASYPITLSPDNCGYVFVTIEI